MLPQLSTQLAVGVKVFLRNKTGKYLLLRRAQPYSGENFCRWDIPGGRIIPGETQIEGLQREVNEETGLEIGNHIQLLTVQDILKVPNKHIVRITYEALYSGTGEIKLNFQEHSVYQWILPKDIQKIRHDNFLDSVIKLLSKQ